MIKSILIVIFLTSIGISPAFASSSEQPKFVVDDSILNCFSNERIEVPSTLTIDLPVPRVIEFSGTKIRGFPTVDLEAECLNYQKAVQAFNNANTFTGEKDHTNYEILRINAVYVLLTDVMATHLERGQTFKAFVDSQLLVEGLERVKGACAEWDVTSNGSLPANCSGLAILNNQTLVLLEDVVEVMMSDTKVNKDLKNSVAEDIAASLNFLHE